MKIIVCGNTIETENIFIITPIKYVGKQSVVYHCYTFDIIMYNNVTITKTRYVEEDMMHEDLATYLDFKNSLHEETAKMVNELIEKYKPITEQKVKELRDFVEKHYAQNQSQIPKIDF